MGSYPVFAKVNFSNLQRFKEEFNIVTDKSDLDLILGLQSILDNELLMFDEIEEFSSKSYWNDISKMPFSKEITTEDDRYLRFIVFKDLVDFLLPSEDLRQEIAQKVNNLSLDTKDNIIKNMIDFLNDYDDLKDCSSKAYYVGNLVSILSVIKQKKLDKKYEVLYELDIESIINKIGFNKVDLIKELVHRNLVEDDLLVVYAV